MTHWAKSYDREEERVAVMEESLEPVFCSEKVIRKVIFPDLLCPSVYSNGDYYLPRRSPIGDNMAEEEFDKGDLLYFDGDTLKKVMPNNNEDNCHIVNSFIRDIELKSYPHDYDLPAGINCSGCPYWLQSKEYAEQQQEPKVWDKGNIQRD